MFSSLSEKLPVSAKKIWRIYSFLQMVGILAIAVLVYWLLKKWSFNSPVILVLVSIVVLAVIFVVIVTPNIRWKVWSYEVREQEIELQSGLFIIKRTIIPMVRVQHVDVEQGPLLKKYELANISVYTAATVHTIPMLSVVQADQLRLKISELARVAQEDV